MPDQLDLQEKSFEEAVKQLLDELRPDIQVDCALNLGGEKPQPPK